MPLFFIELDLTTVLPENRAQVPYLEFPEIPEPIASSKSAIYHDEPIPGRSEPWTSYNYSSARTITFTVKVVATGYWLVLPTRLQRLSEEKLSSAVSGIRRAIPLPPGIADPLETAAFLQLEVHQRIAWLEALTFPQYDRLGRAFAPPAVFLTFGANFTRRGVITDISSSYFGPWHPDLLTSHRVDVTLTFKEQNLVPLGYSDALANRAAVGSTVRKATDAVRSAVDLARRTIGL